MSTRYRILFLISSWTHQIRHMVKSTMLKLVEIVPISHDRDHVTQGRNREIVRILHLGMIPAHDREIQDPEIVTINHVIWMSFHHDRDITIH